jgi:hypothetical protein
MAAPEVISLRAREAARISGKKEPPARFKFDAAQAGKDFKDYIKMFGGCANPPPCLNCSLRVWAYCAESEHCCTEFSQYADSTKSEKGLDDV